MLEQSFYSPDIFVPSPSGERRVRHAKALAESIARHNAENQVPLEEVITTWAVQKGMAFVDKLLETSTYANIGEREKRIIKNLAAKAIGEEWLDRLGLGQAVPVRREIPQSSSSIT